MGIIMVQCLGRDLMSLYLWHLFIALTWTVSVGRRWGQVLTGEDVPKGSSSKKEPWQKPLHVLAKGLAQSTCQRRADLAVCLS